MGRRKSKNRSNPLQIHIYCEGESEKLYLNSLRDLIGIKGRHKLVVSSERKQGLGLYNYVKTKYKNHDFEYSPVTIILVVDKDDTSIDELRKLKNKCVEAGYLLIFSNICFELWLLLHFEKVTSFTTREHLKYNLSNKLGKSYKKTDKKFFEQVVEKYKVALKNSEKMEDGIPNFEKNPYTNMSELLNKYFNIK